MSDDFDKTTNFRIPKEKEQDFGATAVNYRYEESEVSRPSRREQREQRDQRQEQQQTPQQQQPQEEKKGIPGWIWWGLGTMAFFFLLIMGVVGYFLISPSPTYTVVVTGAPPNSRVFAVDKERGTTSTDGTIRLAYLPADVSHNIRIICDCYEEKSDTIKGSAGQVLPYPVTLNKKANCGGTPPPPCPNPPCRTDPNCRPDCLKTDGTCDLECMILKTGKVNLTVNFASGKADILPPFGPLDDVGAILRKNTEWQLRVEGHTDNKGDANYNQKLSEARAKSVMTYFSDRGVTASRMTSKGFGKSKPEVGTVENQTEEQRTRNRRVTIVKTN